MLRITADILLGCGLLWFCFAGAARADILDDDPPPPDPSTLPKDPDAGDEPTKKPPKDPVKNPAKDPVKTPIPKPGTDKPPPAPITEPAPTKGKNERVLAPKQGRKKKDRKDLPVHFESKGLKGLRESGRIELVENVIVTQGTLRMEADKAIVYFDEKAGDVAKVIADGKVKIFEVDEDTGERLKAFGDKMTFDNNERKVVLSGNARLWRGTDQAIRGKRITYELDTGWIRADRVEGEVKPPSEAGDKKSDDDDKKSGSP